MDTTVLGFLASLMNIIFLDLILAGDNAIVIGLAARNLQPATQKKAIIYGTAGAVVLRIFATIVVLWLLNIPWLLLIGGILLVWIAYKLMTDDDDHTDVKASQSLWAAVRTIIIADAAMGIDNVIAVAGAANHNLILVIIGLLISVPIVVWGSTLFIKLISRFPWIIYVGSIVLGYTASNMMTEEKKLQPFFEQYPVLRIVFIIIVTAGILTAGFIKIRSNKRNKMTASNV
ncbi:TerC family protein [Paenibacillus macquariensis]|uniref:Integral membrane protein, YjbE family n=1 Tax=Paenibacillus macquariensis TaxID=948756 RepID=A0ABY1K0W1_9BACL|nr:TerC family protein [Paenibacillus macquariensis]MEC0091888.1 TerC family protein [Paenibacillus macquariensis]OAB32210.1 hypothetical protein PMSM_16460 [Paenibacillus macquariensis subsp. macquariensis]SIR10293.1 integral membrane protein, YjbE family [Paenibacillus macquariensis]